MAQAAYTKRTYGWGDLRVLRKGASYTCVIHPEHLDAIYRQDLSLTSKAIAGYLKSRMA